MEARDPQVHQDEICAARLFPGGKKGPVPFVDEPGTARKDREPLARGLQDGRIRIDADDGEPGIPQEESLRMAPFSQGRVNHEGFPARGDKTLKDFLQQDRLVDDHRETLPPSSSAASLNFASFSCRYAWYAVSDQTSMYFFSPRMRHSFLRSA